VSPSSAFHAELLWTQAVYGGPLPRRFPDGVGRRSGDWMALAWNAAPRGARWRHELALGPGGSWASEGTLLAGGASLLWRHRTPGFAAAAAVPRVAVLDEVSARVRRRSGRATGWASYAGQSRQIPPAATGRSGRGWERRLALGVHVARNNLNLKLGYRRASGAFETAVEETARAHSVVVNRFGRRFGNEADYRELAPALRLFDAVTRTFTNVPCWLVYDRQYAARWGNDAAARPPANTPIDAAGLAATLERFNAYVRDGRDADFGRRVATLGAVAEEPFAAIALHPSIKSSAGLAADNEGRVLNWRGQAIPGLFAAGRLAARIDERPE